MGFVDIWLLVGAAVLFIGLWFGNLSMRFGVPSLLIFLLVGMVAGHTQGTGIHFDNLQVGYLVSNLALAIILMDGGLRTRLDTFRTGFRPALSLATVGVLMTSSLVGGFITWLLGIDWRIGLLLGAIIGSTDAAAVFSVLRSSGVQLNERVSSTVEIESGLNDPMAVFLTLTVIEFLTHPNLTFGLDTLGLPVQAFGIGLVLGLALGFLLAALIRFLHANEGLHALLLCAGGTMIFALTNLAHGSGFLAVYMAGLVVGNRHGGISDNVLRNMDAFGWLAQSCMFLLLGLLVNPDGLIDIVPQALLIALFLMLIARPLATILALLPMNFSLPEQFFIAWSGLRGAVPIVLAMFPLLAGIEHATLLFNVAFVVVLASLLIQGVSMPWLANLLHISLPAPPDPLQVTSFAGSHNLYMMQFAVEKGARACGMPVTQLCSDRTSPLVVSRQDDNLPITDDLKVEEGDRITWLGPISAKALLADLCQTITPSIKRFYGDFTVLGDALVGDLVQVYPIDNLSDETAQMTLDAYFRQQVKGRPVVGDIVWLGKLRLRVRSLDEGYVQQVGIRLPRQ